MSWEVRVPKRVGKSLRGFPGSDRSRLQAVLRQFEVDPWLGDIAKIKDEENSWRRRAGNYRIFYSVEIKRRVVEIKEIERRTSSTY